MIRKSELATQSIWELEELFRERSFDPEDLLDCILANIHRNEAKIHAYLSLADEDVLRDKSREAANALKGANPAALCGIPIAVKDNTDVRGFSCTGGSKLLQDNHPQKDAFAIQGLRDCGAIFLGKTNLDEMAAFGIATNNPHYGRTFNPWDLNRIPGGSSGGSAAAVAACESIASTGSDTGGSIRIPASFCGLVGLKPTFGRIGRSGTITMSWSLDHLGVITRDVRDSALLLSVMSGVDDGDDSTIGAPPFEKHVFSDSPDLSMTSIGVLQNPLCRFDEDIQRIFEESVSVLRGLGAKIIEFSIPFVEEITPAIFAIALPETSAYHEEWLRSSPELYGSVLRSFVELGHGVLATQYIKAHRLKRLITIEVARKLRGLDVVITPTTPSVAPRIDQETIKIDEKEYPTFQVLSENTYPTNFLGLPAMSIPNGFSEGLPTGLQLIAAHWNESSLFKVGDAFQQVTDHHKAIAAV